MADNFAVTTPPLPPTQSPPVDTISDSFNIPKKTADTEDDSAVTPPPPPPPPPPMDNSSAGGINPFRRSNTPLAKSTSSGNTSPFDYFNSYQRDPEQTGLVESAESYADEQNDVTESFEESQYIPNDHRSPFADTYVTHEMPLDVRSSFDNKTHTITSTGKCSPFGYVYDTQKDNEGEGDSATDSEEKSDVLDDVYNGLDRCDDGKDASDAPHQQHGTV